MKTFSRSVSRFSESIAQSAANTIMYIDDNNDTRQETLTKLRGYLETFCNNSAKLNYIDNMTKQLLSIEDGNREELIAQWSQNVSSYEFDGASDKYLKEHDQRIKSLLQNATGQPENQDDDDDLHMTENPNVVLMCPISKSRMTEPMKNTFCGHIYDKTSVISLLEMNNRVRCPMLGCNNKEYLSLDHLQADLVTKMNIESNSI